jgi:hypothetical protein
MMMMMMMIVIDMVANPINHDNRDHRPGDHPRAASSS